MDDDGTNKRIVSSDRIELIKAYERQPTFRGRALAAEDLWKSLSVSHRLELRSKGDHCGRWLQETLGPSDEKAGRPPMTASERGQLKVILNRERGSKACPGKDMGLVWKWLDEQAIALGLVKTLLMRTDRLQAAAPSTPWEAHLIEALDSCRKPRVRPSKKRAESKPSRVSPKRGTVEKTLQFKQLRRFLKNAPDPSSLPIPAGVDGHTYREAYAEMLENVRVVLHVAGHDFHNAKRRYRTTEITAKVGVLAKACRLLRVPVPEIGRPADEFNARRRWLEIVKTTHPDTSGGDATKVDLYTEANKSFEVIKTHNRMLREAATSEEAK